MKNKGFLILLLTIFIEMAACNVTNEGKNEDAAPTATDENVIAKNPDQMYLELQERLQSGWNTWDNRSVLTHVLLPDGLGIILGLEDIPTGSYNDKFFTGNRIPGTEQVRTIAHTPDGSFTHLILEWKNIDIRVRTASHDEELYIMVAPDSRNRGNLHVKSEMIYGGEAAIKLADNKIQMALPDKEITLHANGLKTNIENGESLVYDLKEAVYLSTKDISPQEIKNTIDEAEMVWLDKKEAYGGRYSEAAEVYSAVQNALNWLTVYDPEKDRIVTPVARTWAYGWGKGEPGGYVLFCWDNYFAAWMHSIESRDLAFNEAIQMTNYIEELGFVPNYAGPGGVTSRDRSQPPVGSMCVKKIYDRHPEKWFLAHQFDKLMTWNRFWDEKRNNEGLLSWGSHPFITESSDKRELVQNNFKAASNESGLDNTPMYDGVEFDTLTNMLKIQDVGLTGLYIMDCEALAYIANELGREKEREELLARAELYRKNMQPLWDSAFGLFLNRHIESGELSKRISPTNFYALNGSVASQKQAQQMMEEHYYNPEEFYGEYVMPSVARNDTAYTGADYWRGSIWAPMNLLVYWGMQNYELPEARKDLAEKSKNLLLKNWHERGWVRENYNAETGGFNFRSEHFYHWGALLGMIYLVEEGYIEK